MGIFGLAGFPINHSSQRRCQMFQIMILRMCVCVCASEREREGGGRAGGGVEVGRSTYILVFVIKK